MQNSLDLIISGAEVLAPDPKTGQLKRAAIDIGIKDGKISELAPTIKTAAAATMSAKGLTALPGAIDTQVHFRDPGFPEKETL